MESFPSNANSAKKVVKETTVTTKRTVEEPAKKVEKVTTGDVVLRKPPLGKRLLETFLGGDAKGVAAYVLMDVLIPSARDTIVDAVIQGVERLVYPDGRSRARGTTSGYRGASTPGYVSYNRFSGPSSREREEPREISRQARAHHNFDEILLATRAEAEQVIDRLFDLVNRYEQATVADLYDLVGISTKPGNYTDDKWGWEDMRGASVRRTRNGYLLDLPRPEPLRS